MSAARNGFAAVGNFFNRRDNLTNYCRKFAFAVRSELEAEANLSTIVYNEDNGHATFFVCLAISRNVGVGYCHFGVTIGAYGIAFFIGFSGRATTFAARNKSYSVAFV